MTPASKKGDSLADPVARKVILYSILSSVLVVAFFYAVDLFASKSMSPIFTFLLMVFDIDSAWLALLVCFLAACWPHKLRLEALVRAIGDRYVSVSVAFGVIVAASAIVVYKSHPLSMDEYAAAFQAKVFASGHIYAQLPPSAIDWLLPRGFNGAFLLASHISGRALEAYWPGYALLLAPFQVIGMPWLCNALLAVAAIALVHSITFKISASRTVAGWAVLFTVASGAFLANAASFYSMHAHLTLNLLFVWLLLRNDFWSTALAGFVGSIALLLHNPFPHFLFALPWIISILVSSRHRLIPLALGYVPLVVFIGGGWLVARIAVAADEAALATQGSFAAAFCLPNSDMLWARAAALAKMQVWALPGLFVLAGLGWHDNRAKSEVRLLAYSAVLTFAGYMFVIFDQGHGWGFRYFHSAWGVIPVLAALAMQRGPESVRLSTFSGAAAVLNLVLVLPLQLVQIHEFIANQLNALPTSPDPGKHVYFIRYPSGFYTSDLVQMDPLLRGDTLVLASRGELLDHALIAQNWPLARLVAKSPGVQEWRLGDTEDWIRDAGATGLARYSLHFQAE